MRIAVDVMGGDFAPSEVLAGALMFLNNTDNEIILVGKNEIIEEELKNYSYSQDKLSVVHASQVVEMNESAVAALRKKKDSSIMVASKLVQEGKADALVSCGNTGAQMAAAMFIIGRLEGIDRPPVITPIPNISGGYTLLVDVGANLDCKPKQLVQFAILGKEYANIALGIKNPRIMILNNGTEESKGNQLSQETYKLLQQEDHLQFLGNIEGRDIFNNLCDVIVCDGFLGNILLKTIEGMATFIQNIIKEKVPEAESLMAGFDYSKVGGAPLLGIEGVSIVCHGSSKREAVQNALKIAQECVEKDMVLKQKKALEQTLAK